MIKKKFVLIMMFGLLFLQSAMGASLSPFDKALIQTTNEIAKAQGINKSTKIAVMGFQDSSTKRRLLISSVIEDELSNYLINKMPGRLIAKNHIDTVLRELKITRDDVFDGKNRKQFGKLLSADLIVTGTYWVNDGMVNINIVIVDIESGLAVFSDRIKVKKNSFSKELFKESPYS